MDLVRAGRSPEDLAKEFEPTAESIRSWVCQADLARRRRHDGLKTGEREELPSTSSFTVDITLPLDIQELGASHT